MTIAKSFAPKLAVAFVASAMIFSMFASSVKAQTTEDLQAQITELLAKIAGLQSNVGQGSTGVASGVCPYTWTRDLNAGSTGADVMKLQQFLNADLDTRVSVSGAGSVGAETEYYGPATAAAVSKFQVKYRSDILSPANLVNPTGYFGPSSRAKANASCVAGSTTDDSDEMDDEDDDSSSSVTLGGEASLDVFQINDGDDEVEEGDSDMVIGEIEVEFTDGDAQISRIDFAILEDGETDTIGSGVAQPWDAFDTFSLWVDGDKVAEVDASDEDDYLDEDDGSFRFTGLDIIAMEDETVDILVAASIQNNLDSDELANWSLYALEIRFFDADGVATTEDGDDDLSGDEETITDGASADFEIVVEGDGDELELRSSSQDPDETTIIVDKNDNEEAMFFAFDLDASDSDGDIEINSIFVDIEISSTTGAINDLVDDFYIEIDGDKFDAESYVGTGDTVTLEFDVDGDFVLDNGDRVTVLVYADFENMESDSYYQGVTINGSVDKTGVVSEGAEDIVTGGSNQAGEFHPVRSEGIAVEYSDSASKTTVNGNTVTFTFVVDVTAVGDDALLTLADFNFSTTGPGASTPTISTTLDATDGGVDEVSANNFEFDEDQTPTFTFKVFVTTLDAGDAGLYSVTLDDIDGTEVDETLDEVANFSS